MTTFETLTAAGLALALSAAAAAGAETFRYGTNWVAEAEHGGFYQAVADGTYAACGLDVEIVPGGPQVNGRALLLAGRLDAYMGGSLLQPFAAIAEGVPVVVVAALFQKEPQVLLTHPSRVASFEDIAKEELKVLTSDEAFVTWYRMLMIRYGFKEEARAPYTFNPAPFIADPDVAQQGYVTSEPFAVERETGWSPDVWLLAEHGFSTYATTIEVTRETLATRRDAIQCFVEGSALGWVNYLYGDNTAANDLIKAHNPDMSDEQIAYSIEAMKKYGIVISGDVETLGIGAMTDARMRQFYDDMVASDVLPAGLDITQAYTLEFVNKGAGLDRLKELTGQ
ncbi:MAG TPA: ABC transporter substrate-binding protein [Paracoccaceae bacterium]|nr:ABC transporter substrate-binding protein [Paracoccaceae bacterium]